MFEKIIPFFNSNQGENHIAMQGTWKTNTSLNPMSVNTG